MKWKKSNFEQILNFLNGLNIQFNDQEQQSKDLPFEV